MTPTSPEDATELRSTALRLAMHICGTPAEISVVLEAARQIEAYLRGPDAKPE